MEDFERVEEPESSRVTELCITGMNLIVLINDVLNRETTENELRNIRWSIFYLEEIGAELRGIVDTTQQLFEKDGAGDDDSDDN